MKVGIIGAGNIGSALAGHFRKLLHTVGRPVIKVFNNILTDSLLQKALPKGSKNRIALPEHGRP
jgi:glycerol-3-phosphate dehydrogenase